MFLCPLSEHLPTPGIDKELSILSKMIPMSFSAVCALLGYHTRSRMVLARGNGVQDTTNAIIERTKLFSKQVETLRFSCDCYIYNPLEYAWPMHEAYLRAYVKKPVKTLLVGMNPGPFGMAQTGVPFGEINAVRHFLRLSEEIGKPPAEHPARPILGLQTTRSEVSGKRLWSLMQAHYQVQRLSPRKWQFSTIARWYSCRGPRRQKT